MSDDTIPAWLSHDDWMILISDRPSLPGDVEEHGLKDWWRNLTAKPIEDGKAEFQRIFFQIDQLLSGVPKGFREFETESLEIGLAFTAEGQLAFIAKAGLEASVKVTLKRRDGDSR